MASNEITSTHDMAEAEWEAGEEPRDVDTKMVATVEAEGKGIEFHVSMRSHTMRDMEALIVEAAAMQLVGRRSERELAKAIEAKALALIDAKATEKLAGVTAEIIDQPMTPNFGDKQPVTMREFLGLYGREYLTQVVGSDGKPDTSSYGRGKPRITWLVERAMDATFKREIEKATNAAITEIQGAIREQHKALLAAETARIRDAIAKATAA